MRNNEQKQAAAPVPAATIMILRDAPQGMEVFMVKRHHQIDFVAGALVFPGGKVSGGDFDAALDEYMDGNEGWSGPMCAIAAAAIREAFEESGILYAREPGARELVSSERIAALAPYRKALDSHEINLLDFLREEKLHLACDQLVHFAHWITPDNMPKRFDTHFFVAHAPSGHIGAHDGHESVDSVWITPQNAINDRKKWNVIFPTKLNLMKLATCKNVDETLRVARAHTPITVTPWVEQGEDGPILRIRDDAGYTQTSTSLKTAL